MSKRLRSVLFYTFLPILSILDPNPVPCSQYGRRYGTDTIQNQESHLNADPDDRDDAGGGGGEGGGSPPVCQGS